MIHVDLNVFHLLTIALSCVLVLQFVLCSSPTFTEIAVIGGAMIISLWLQTLTELVLGWRNLMLILLALGITVQVLFVCKGFDVSLYAYLALSIVAQPKFPVHLINSRASSLKMLDIKLAAYVAALFVIAMVLVFNKYGLSECEKLAPMFLCFQALESFTGIFLVRDNYKKNLLLDTIRL